MKRSLRLAAAALLVVALNAPAYGWNNVGHMAVAYVAYQKLSPQARRRADALVRLNPKFGSWQSQIPGRTSAADRRMMLFMIAATWPDQIKGDSRYRADGPNGGNLPPDDGTADRNIGYRDRALHKYWHFIDRPFSPDRTPLRDPPAPNAKTQIAAFRQVLASDSPDSLKSYDLVWLLHLVGDVHQPLHATARFTRENPDGDDGGNEVRVCNPNCGVRLHSFWDGLLGGEGISINPRPAVTVGRGLPEADAAQAENLNVDDWLTESFDLARSTAYKNPPIGFGPGPFTLSQAYRDAAREVANRRVALAGARLANILNNELR
jgi:hypothetical protein